MEANRQGDVVEPSYEVCLHMLDRATTGEEIDCAIRAAARALVREKLGAEERS